jgi:hypothetical protein
MSAADSIKLETGQDYSITTDWQNLWELCNAKYIADGIPPFNKHCRTLNLEAPSTNSGTVEWARTSIGDNPAGSLRASDSILRQSGNMLNNENMYNIYVRGSDGTQELLVERTQ